MLSHQDYEHTEHKPRNDILLDQFPDQRYRKECGQYSTYSQTYDSASHSENTYLPQYEDHVHREWEPRERSYESEYGQTNCSSPSTFHLQSRQHNDRSYQRQSERYYEPEHTSDQFPPHAFHSYDSNYPQHHDNHARLSSSSSTMTGFPNNYQIIDKSFESMLSSHSSSNSMHSYPLVTKVNNNDVLCGRGGATNVHIGNRRFRSIVKKYQQQYLSAKKKDKPAVAGIVVDIIRNENPPGRFLKKDNIRNGWYDIGDVKAKEKTSQALREGAPIMRQIKHSTSQNLREDEATKEVNNTRGDDATQTKIQQKRGPNTNNPETPDSWSSNVQHRSKRRVTMESTEEKTSTPSENKKNSSLDSLSPEDKILYAAFDPPRSKISKKPHIV